MEYARTGMEHLYRTAVKYSRTDPQRKGRPFRPSRCRSRQPDQCHASDQRDSAVKVGSNAFHIVVATRTDPSMFG